MTDALVVPIAGRESRSKEPRPPVRVVLAAAIITLLAGALETWAARLGHSLFLAADSVHLLAHMGVYGALLVPKRVWTGRGEEVRTALVLGVVFVIACAITVASVDGLINLNGHARVEPRIMLMSLVGLGANAVTAWMFRVPSQHQLSFRAAFVHELSDGAMTGVGLLGAGVIAVTGWRWVDPILSLAIGGWLLSWTAKWLCRTIHACGPR